MGWGAAIMGGAAIAGAYMSSQSQQNAANTAANAATSNANAANQAQMQMYNQSQAMHMPYQTAGMVGVNQLLGGHYGQLATDSPNIGLGSTSSILGAFNDPNVHRVQYGEHVYHPQQSGGTGGAGGGVDPTGGAGKYRDALANLNTNNLPGIPGLKGFNYSFDENDPAYQFKLKQAQKTIDQAAAARGNYNSRPVINAHADASMAITADEAEKQYGRQRDMYGLGRQNILDTYGMRYDQANNLYGRNVAKNTDLFNQSMQLGQTDYGRVLDLVKIGQGSAGQAGQNAIATGQGISSAYGQLGAAQAQAAYAQGNAQADFYSGIAPTALNAYSMYQANQKPWTPTTNTYASPTGQYSSPYGGVYGTY
jgi:hypothetical protein